MHQLSVQGLALVGLFVPTSLSNSCIKGLGQQIVTPQELTAESVQKAIREAPANSTVYIPAGEYLVKNPIVVDRSDINIEGAGKKATIFKLADNINKPLFVIGSDQTSKKTYEVPEEVSNISFQNIGLNGNCENQQLEVHSGDINSASDIRNNCLTLRRSKNVRVVDVETWSGKSGGVVTEKGCSHLTFISVYSHDNQFDGFACYQTSDSIFEDLTLSNNKAAGISLDIKFDRNIIKNCRLENNGSQGIFMRDSQHNHIVDTKIIGSGLHGAFLARDFSVADSDAKNNTFTRVTIKNNGGEGIRINDASCVNNTVCLESIIEQNKKDDISYAEGLPSPVQIASSK